MKTLRKYLAIITIKEKCWKKSRQLTSQQDRFTVKILRKENKKILAQNEGLE
jgi:hypothetical protein